MIIINKLGVLKIILIIFSLVIGGLFLIDYMDFTSLNNKNNISINYIFKEKKREIAGRGSDHHKMVFLVNNETNEIYLTEKEYNMIDKGLYPKIYQSNNSKKYYSESTIGISLRYIIFCSISIFLIYIVPPDLVDIILKRLNKIKKSRKRAK